MMKTDYRKEVSTLIEWSHTHNLTLNVFKTNQIVFDFDGVKRLLCNYVNC